MTVLKTWFIILSLNCPRIAFRDERCLALISYLLEQKQIERSSDIVVSAFCTSIGDEYVLPCSLQLEGKRSKLIDS